VLPEKSQTLVDGSLNSRVEFHDGGESRAPRSAVRS
jgi:hypothetical protein